MSLKARDRTNDNNFVLKDNQGPRPRIASLVFSRRNIPSSFIVVRIFVAYIGIVTCTGEGELERGKGKKLADYQLINGTTITVCVRVRGGPGRLQPIPGLIGVTTREPDMISLDDSPTEPRAKMPCGHVISEEAFTICCIHFC